MRGQVYGNVLEFSRQEIHLSSCLSVPLSIHPSVYSSVCLFVFIELSLMESVPFTLMNADAYRTLKVTLSLFYRLINGTRRG